MCAKAEVRATWRGHKWAYRHCSARVKGRCAIARVLVPLNYGVLVLLFLAGCWSADRRPPPIVVASADSPEQLVLGKMTVLTLKAAGYRVTDKTGLGTPWVVRAALEAGNVDVWWEYTGNTWAVHLGHDQRVAEPNDLYEKVRQQDARKQITWLPPAPCQHSLALLMGEQVAQGLDIASIGDLVRYMERVDPRLSLCVPKGLYGAVSGIRGLERFYDLHFDESRVQFMSMAEGYRSLARGECDCVLGYSTDGEIASGSLRTLKDDRGFFQVSNLSVAVRTPLLQESPDLASALGEVAELLTQRAIIDLNRQVAIDGDKPEAVARRFLIINGVIGRWPGDKDR